MKEIQDILYWSSLPIGIILFFVPEIMSMGHRIRLRFNPSPPKPVSVDANYTNWSFKSSQPKVTVTHPPWYRRAWLKIRSWVRGHIGEAATSFNLNKNPG